MPQTKAVTPLVMALNLEYYMKIGFMCGGFLSLSELIVVTQSFKSRALCHCTSHSTRYSVAIAMGIPHLNGQTLLCRFEIYTPITFLKIRPKPNLDIIPDLETMLISRKKH